VIAPGAIIRRRDTLTNIDKEFVRRQERLGRPDYIGTRKGFQDQYKALVEKLKTAQAKQPMPCSEQHAYEAKWLISYSDHWDEVGNALKAFDDSLSDTHQSPLEQDAEGSWGRCYAQWYRKLEPTIDALQEERLDCRKANPLAFMERLKDIGSVLQELDRLSVSNIVETGWNHRDEHGAWLTALSQLAFKEKVRTVLDGCPNLKFALPPGYVDRYRDYLWKEQLDNGFWGPTYRFDGEEVSIQDLSFTFHVVHYYTQDRDKPPLPNLDRIAATTLAIKDRTYPNGWLNRNGELEDHNNYDVAVLFARSWDHAPPELRKDIAAELQRLTNWCVTKSLNGTQFGTGTADVASYYYGVRFLDEIGLWDAEQRFWHEGQIPLPDGLKAECIRDDLRRGFAKVDDGSEYAETIRDILDP
jgi:hypothetical protein